MSDIAFILSFITIIALICQWVSWRLRIPAILFLLSAGLIMGPATSFIQPDELLGNLLMPFVSLSVAIILFEGSLTLKLEEFRELGVVVQRMVTLGALIMWGVIATVTYWLFQFDPKICALFGALMVVTGPTVIVPMLRSVRPNRKIANTLRWEGIVIDPVGALLAVVTYEFIISGQQQSALSIFFETILTGCVFGIGGGYLLGFIMKKHLLPEYLHGMAALGVVLFSYTISNHIHHESGLIAVTAMGMLLGNTKTLDIEHILNFKENLSVLLISVLFIILAARIDFQQVLLLGWQPFIILLAIQFIARPIKVFISTLGTDFTLRENILLAWIAPRGIVAAAISAIFAERLMAIGYDEAAFLVPLTFWIIITSVVLQSVSAKPLAKLLGVAEPEPRGFLLIGANIVSRTLAKTLQEQGFRCILTDSNWQNISEARMMGLNTYYGSPVSEHADRHLDLSGIGNLLALSQNKATNIAACVHYRADFGPRGTFSLPSKEEQADRAKHNISREYHSTVAFGEDMTYGKLASLINQKYELKTTTLSESYTWEDYLIQNDKDTYYLFYIDNKNNLYPFTRDDQVKPKDGWSIISLQAPSE